MRGFSYFKLPENISTIPAGSFNTFKSNTDVVLSSNTTYDTLFSVTGSGLFIGATFVVDDKKIDCVVELDGFALFDFNGEFLQEVVNKDSDYEASAGFGVTADGKRLYFRPNVVLPYTTSLVFKARKSGKKIKYQLYTYSVT